MKKISKFLFSKLFLILIAVAVQIGAFCFIILKIRDASIIFSALLIALKLIFMLKVINSEIAPAYKISWLTVILINTLGGVALYFFFGRVKLRKKARERLEYMTRELGERSESYEAAKVDDHTASRVCTYLAQSCNSVPFAGNKSTYFPSGEEFFERFFEEVESAEKYIYLEFFIVSNGRIWDRLFDVLEKKVKAGVEVKLIYDDIGSILYIDRSFIKRLRNTGIEYKAFNRISPAASSRQNNRDHRKICVIDGREVFIGGVNLSDEYANITHPYKYWKDTAVLIEGTCAEAYTNEFLAVFYALLDEKGTVPQADFSSVESFDEKGITAPYFDCPFENRQICRDVLREMISGAKESICITTPYFVPDYDIETALKNALLCGVSVRIVIPGTYDKWYVRELSKLYAARLTKYGAEVYEYEPGFIHQKTFLIDGKYVLTGSSNLDYRSLYLSFENGVFMYDTPCIADIKADFEKTLSLSEVLNEESDDDTLLKWLFRYTFAIFAPLV